MQRQTYPHLKDNEAKRRHIGRSFVTSVFDLLRPSYVQVAEFKCLLGVKANTKE
ncbi:hypothetical protein Bca4012_004542 [Brassica carinata]|uniref:Uncharacterized protein n=1 Tax=Brassica cretica TaxID=69181 RepID=A0A8S9P2E4_BRACR|nr:hypothetical protein F2Q69_00003884 [Brassica cretica]